MRVLMMGIVGLGLAATACNNADANPAPSAGAQPAKSAAPPPASVANAAPRPTLEIKIATVGNTMAYDLALLTAAAGQSVHLVLQNNSTTDALPHNWVLVKPGTEAAVAEAGLKAGPTKDYVQPSTDVLAFTPLAVKQGTTAVTFNAPATPGIYPFISTAPGQATKMKGLLTVTQ